MRFRNPWPRSLRGQELEYAARRMRDARKPRVLRKNLDRFLGPDVVDSWLMPVDRMERYARLCPSGWSHPILPL